MGLVVSLSQLQSELSGRRKMTPRRPPRVVFTNGCFDILHVGHIRYLKEARALGDILVVGLNSDESVSQLKGPDRPIQNEGDRAELLASVVGVDYVTIFAESTPEFLVETVSPEVLVKGGDWEVEAIAGAKFVLAKGGEVRVLKFHQGYSTTGLMQKILRL